MGDGNLCSQDVRRGPKHKLVFDERCLGYNANTSALAAVSNQLAHNFLVKELPV